MSDSVEFYQQQAHLGISKMPWLLHLQEQALQEFKRVGFPTRHDEDWKYTSVESFLSHRFVLNKDISLNQSPKKRNIPIEHYSLPIINGMFSGSTTEVPSGVVIIPMAQALEKMPDQLEAYLGRILKRENAFHALNTAMSQQGLFIYIPKDVCLEKPLHLSHWQDKEEQAVNLRHLIVMEADAQLTIIEDYAGLDSTCYFTNTITEVVLAPKARLTHYKIQSESKQAYHFGHIAVQQAMKSEFNSHSISLGGKWVRSDISIELMEPGAECLMNGLYLPNEGQHVDHHTLVQHFATDCQSAQNYKGILNGKSRAVFNGRVLVAEGAQHTKATQQNKNLLLSAHAEIDTKPQLEISADDVICTHGATVGQLDGEALFYLATRGICREEGSHYLINAFINENIKLFANEKIAIWISNLLNEQLG